MMETVSRRMTDNETLPESWEWTTLSEIGTVTSGGTPKTKEPSNFDGDIPWITPADLSGYTDKTIAQGRRNISQKGLDSSSARLLPEGTVVFSSRAPVGYVVIAGNPVSTNQGCKNLIPSDGVFNEYVFYYLKGSKSLAESYASGTTFLELSAKAFGRLPIPLPPLNEQRRIVEKIEELFTKLDAGVRSLEQARAQLKSYRRSVLKAAVEGELSREWREAHGDELEPASELLKRILQERREKFAGKKYKEPSSPDTSELPILPDGWEWATVDQLASAEPNSLTDGPFGSNLKTAHYTASGPRVVRLQNIAPHTFIDEEAHISDEHYEGLKKHAVYTGDLVIRALGEPAPVACAIPSWLGRAIVKADCIKFRPAEDYVGLTYVMYALNSYPVQQRTTAIIHGIGRPRLNLTEIKNITIPLPPTVEQPEIAGEVERRFSVVDKLEATVEANLKQAAGLRQSILKQAFSGELVPQDPDDEPASVLLERIREERQATTQKAGKTSVRARQKVSAGDQTLELFPEQGE